MLNYSFQFGSFGSGCDLDTVFSKLRGLGFPNQIVLFNSNLESKFDCQFWFDSDSNDEIVSTIMISI